MGDRSFPGSIRLTTRYVERDGRPWFPIMAEYHFSRDLPESWETELRKIKSGGVNIVATYLLWILHEEVRGQVRWDGARDLRRFIETAHRVGLKVVIRIGPWAHGETRNGGFPDWLQELPIAHRTNDPAYLALAGEWYRAIAEQVSGLFHDEANPDGPIVGVQIDNELYDQPEHLITLRELAEEHGIRASLWTVTGWGGAQIPAGRFLPVYAGYSDAFWEESTTGWPSFGKMHFTFNTVRDDLSVGADLRDAPAEGEAVDAVDDPWPFATCELGGGMQVAYHRRPHVAPADVAALALVKLGSGSAWQGYYLYHGATQVFGGLSTTQESHATGYPNDLPLRDYDFYAPIGRNGEEREHFHSLRRQHLLLETYGHRLATYPTVLPEGSDDVRWAVRGDENGGYLFINNHQPAIAPLAGVEDVQFEVEFSERTLRVPEHPFALRSGVFAAWPLRQPFGSVRAVTATAQPVTEITVESGTVVLLAATAGVPVEIRFEGVDAGDVRGGRVRERDGVVIVTPTHEPGLDCEVVVGDTTFVILDSETADAVWKGEIDGRSSIVIWRGEGWFDEDGFRLIERADSAVIAVLPALHDTDMSRLESVGSHFSRYEVVGRDVLRSLKAPVFDIPAIAPVVVGGTADRFSAPTDEDFAALAPVLLHLEDAWFDDGDRLLLELDWVGDAIRLSSGDELLADQFWSGRLLVVDLAPHREQIRRHGLTARAFAWSPDTGVYVDPRFRPDTSMPSLFVRSAELRAVRSRAIR
ncbi:beta-galactosidase [Microbacterium sp.]|uniref:beta-galactosidase n=1 Tax=Microbacterium sp. TaxID=51671 RepID=UPI002732427E|nr:beta-galactosidase [Microbacterium sp.]MDP3951954.1 beta-galactosidase [Microbacterium sp.]